MDPYIFSYIDIYIYTYTHKHIYILIYIHTYRYIYRCESDGIYVFFRGSRVWASERGHSAFLFHRFSVTTRPPAVCLSLLLEYLLHHTRTYAPGTWDIGAGML